LGQTFPIPTHVRAMQMKYMDAKTLYASYLSFNIGNSRHSFNDYSSAVENYIELEWDAMPLDAKMSSQ
jgi:hypothetical protein